MVGRRKDGAPLVDCPHAAPEADAFRYRIADAEGFQCPLGAHVRRGNPRDTLAWDVESGVASSKLHRLLRRARVYTDGCRLAEDGRCGHDDGRRGCGRGLFFIALNADLDRQFEFVQQRWVGNPHFAGLANESDPLMGGRGRRAFTVQGLASGQAIEDLPAFTALVGGGYFFLPGLAALRFLGQDPAPAGAGRLPQACREDADDAAPRPLD
jgi:putative iron-dependent peroxidase